MINRLFQFVILMLVISPLALSASIQRPDTMLNNVTQEMLTALRKHDNEIKSNPARLVQIIEKILVPHVDSSDMARWVVGRNAWVKATPSQRSRFTNEFKDLLIRTYASSLTTYSNQTVVYFPVKENLATKSRVQVTSSIQEPGRSPITVSCR